MRKMLLTVGALLAAVGLCCAGAFAHSGGTDANGGHWNHKTGEYHYHHGYPAHQHTNGICPYDYDDQTGASSGSSGGSSSSSVNSSSGGASTSSNNPVMREIHGYPYEKKVAGPGSQEAADEISSSEGSDPIVLFKLAFVACAMALSWKVSQLVSERKQKQLLQTALDYQRAELEKAFAERQAAALEQQRRELFGLTEDEADLLLEEKDPSVTARQAFLTKYGGKRLSEIVPPPQKGDHIGEDGLPCGKGRGRWGRYTVYITEKGEVYHSQSVCGTACGRPLNLAQAQGRRPCSRCCRHMPGLVWYDEQKKLYDESMRLFGYSVFLEDTDE